MTFKEWWGTISDAKQKLIGINNARFVWEEAQKNRVNILALPTFTMARFGDRITIMSHHGEGGDFDLQKFDSAVGKFFAENF